MKTRWLFSQLLNQTQRVRHPRHGQRLRAATRVFVVWAHAINERKARTKVSLRSHKPAPSRIAKVRMAALSTRLQGNMSALEHTHIGGYRGPLPPGDPATSIQIGLLFTSPFQAAKGKFAISSGVALRQSLQYCASTPRFVGGHDPVSPLALQGAATG